MSRVGFRAWLACGVGLVILGLGASLAQAQPAGPADEFLSGFNYRLLGPFRGGRSGAVEGVRGQPMTFYMGATGGGVWRTDDGGTTWRCVSDGFFGGSIGAVAVAPSDSTLRPFD